MARGIALSVLVANLRKESGRSATAIANADEDAKLKTMLARIQEFYYDDYDWPHLSVLRSMALVVNTRFYPFPSDMVMENIEALWVKDSSRYLPLDRGVSFDQYNVYDSLLAVAATGTVTVDGGTSNPGTNKITAIDVNSVDVLVTDVDWTTSHAATAALIATQINSTTSSPDYTATSSGAVVTITAKVAVGTGANAFTVSATVAGDVTTTDVAMASGVDAEQGGPIQHWDIREDDEASAERIEVWPVPSAEDTFWITGKRNLTAFTADSDTCDLDDQLLVMTAAAELLARSDKKDGEAKAAAAKLRYAQSKKNSKKSSGPIMMRGSAPDGGVSHYRNHERLRGKWS